ncbi:MAG: hypothetical protein ACI4JC_10285 [Faecalibacterium sp.]
MQSLKLPTSCALLSQEEQRSTTGGGPLLDALDTFFENIHLDNILWGGSFVALSFTFVPSLLFNVFNIGFSMVKNLIDNTSSLLGVSTETVTRSLLDSRSARSTR